MNLVEQRIVIVGGTSGIGLGVARAMLDAGAQIVVASSRPDKAAGAARQLGDRARGETVDVADEGSIRTFLARIGAFDHLVATPGAAAAPAPVAAARQEDAERIFRVKFWGQYLLAKHAGPLLPERGSLVLTSGVLSQRPAPGRGALAAVNAAIEALGRTLALELSPRRVNVVCPGFVDTGKLRADLTGEERQRRLQAEQGDELPARRVGQPADLAAAYLFAIANPYLTGQTLVVDGGSSLV